MRIGTRAAQRNAVHTRHTHATAMPPLVWCATPPPRRPCSFITVFVTVFATVIAITKDLPDIEGDQKNNIETFATRVGVKKVAQLGE